MGAHRRRASGSSRGPRTFLQDKRGSRAAGQARVPAHCPLCARAPFPCNRVRTDQSETASRLVFKPEFHVQFCTSAEPPAMTKDTRRFSGDGPDVQYSHPLPGDALRKYGHFLTTSTVSAAPFSAPDCREGWAGQTPGGPGHSWHWASTKRPPSTLVPQLSPEVSVITSSGRCTGLNDLPQIHVHPKSQGDLMWDKDVCRCDWLSRGHTGLGQALNPTTGSLWEEKTDTGTMATRSWRREPGEKQPQALERLGAPRSWKRRKDGALEPQEGARPAHTGVSVRWLHTRRE